jgi:hypothetical protein
MTQSKRKFGALADLRRPEPAISEPASPASPVSIAEPERGPGKRPVGKRSDPEWKLYSHFLKRKTQRAAAALLLAEGENGPDLSDVLQSLLEGWIAQQTRGRTGASPDDQTGTRPAI